MRVSVQAGATQGVARIREILLAARAQLASDEAELAAVFRAPPPAPGGQFPDPVPALNRMREHLQAVRAEILQETGGGVPGATARTLSARAILETDEALAKLVEARLAPAAGPAAVLLEESVRLRVAARKSSTQAGNALGIPWPL